MDHQQQPEAICRESLEKRPGILIVGSPNVGKRTLISRLLSLDFDDVSDSSSDILPYGWTINTKYYTVDVCLWMANLHEEFSIATLPNEQLAALVMVFDTSDLTSFVELRKWVSHIDIQNFDILLCIGNKVDLLPGHPAHAEYRRRLAKVSESSGEFGYEVDYGISEFEGSSLLGDEEPSWEIKRSCMDWCIEHGIEYIEACASNADFDKCLSIDGDSQGAERLYGALSAHMWPGMVLKSGDKITEPSLPEQEESSDEESDIELEYERLSEGLADQWDDTETTWISADSSIGDLGAGGTIEKAAKDCVEEGEHQPSASTSQSQGDIDLVEMTKADEDGNLEHDKDPLYKFEDLEQLMSEIGGMRDGLRLMPDFQRREMAAKLAMKMATMFGDNSEDDEDAKTLLEV